MENYFRFPSQVRRFDWPRLEELRTRELEFEKSLKQEQSKKDSLEDEAISIQPRNLGLTQHSQLLEDS